MLFYDWFLNIIDNGGYRGVPLPSRTQNTDGDEGDITDIMDQLSLNANTFVDQEDNESSEIPWNNNE